MNARGTANPSPEAAEAYDERVRAMLRGRRAVQRRKFPGLDVDVGVRPLAPADIPRWYAYLAMPVVFEHTSWNVQSPSELEDFATLSESPSARLRLAIVERSTDQLVGTIGFHTVSPENRTAELAYDLSPRWWGKGIASHMCEVMVQWAHDHVGLLRVQATVLTSNNRSIEVLQRCRFKREGLLRSYRMVRGRPGDFWMYSHVRSAT